jgi:hypothetical protein
LESRGVVARAAHLAAARRRGRSLCGREADFNRLHARRRRRRRRCRCWRRSWRRGGGGGAARGGRRGVLFTRSVVVVVIVFFAALFLLLFIFVLNVIVVRVLNHAHRALAQGAAHRRGGARRA